MSIIDERLELLGSIRLEKGGHEDFESGVCVMEAAAWLAGEPHSDHPACVSPVIGAFLRSWNDDLPDIDRDRFLKPLIPLAIGTKTTKKDETTRAWMCTDWLVRVQTPAWLRLAGLTEHAAALESLVPLTSAATARKAQPAIDDALKPASAAWAAARAAAWAAAGDAAWSAAWAAARAAARDAARDAAGAAAGAAAWDAARAAARAAAWAAAGAAALAPTVATLQQSAVLLVTRMCDVGRN